MPFPPHYRAVIDGGWLNGTDVVERWSTSYRITSDQAFGAGLLNEQDYINNELTDFCTRLFAGPAFTNQVFVDKLSFNRIGPDGRYADGSASHSKVLTGASIIKGTNTGGRHMPLQVAMVGSLRSDVARGPGSHGRMFLPCPDVVLGSDYTVPVVDRDVVLGRLVDAFNHADGVATAATGITFYPALVSAKGTTGTRHRITRVGLGRVLDTVRSRRRSLPENHAFTTLS